MTLVHLSILEKLYKMHQLKKQIYYNFLLFCYSKDVRTFLKITSFKSLKITIKLLFRILESDRARYTKFVARRLLA